MTTDLNDFVEASVREDRSLYRFFPIRQTGTLAIIQHIWTKISVMTERTDTARVTRRRGRPRKGMRTAAISPDVFDTVPMMRLAGRYGTKGMAAAVVVVCAISAAGYCLEWTEREKWLTLRRLPDMTVEELDEVVKAMALEGILDEATYVRHGVLTSRDIQDHYFSGRSADAALPYIISDEADTDVLHAHQQEETASRTEAREDVRVTGITAYTPERTVYYYGDTAISYNKDGLNAEKYGIYAEKYADKETERKKDKEESVPTPPKEEKEIKKEKETAAFVPNAVSARPSDESDAARSAEVSESDGRAERRAETKSREPEVNYSVVRTSWNSMMDGKGIPLLRSEIRGQRKRMFAARVREHGKDTVWRVMRSAAASSYLNGGGSKGWTATFDWLFRPTNFQKVLDGHYDNSRTMRMRRGVVLGSAGVRA